MASQSTSWGTSYAILRLCALLAFVHPIASYSYALFGARRYMRPVPIRRSSYYPLTVTHPRSDYHLPDYDDEFMVSPQEEYEYNAFEKYPYMQYFSYYPGKDYYREKAARSLEGYEYFDDRLPQTPDDVMTEDLIKDGIYPYGQETWYEEEVPRYDGNAQTNAAFLQNLIMAQMYQDAKNQHPFGYESTADDYDDQHWFYGVPTTEVEEKEKVKQYFKNKEDEEVKELESLARKKSNSKKLKEKNSFTKQKPLEVIDKPTKPKSKMTDDEYFDLQKQIVLNSRKNNFVPVAEGLRLSKKQKSDDDGDYIYFPSPVEVNPNLYPIKIGVNKPQKTAKAKARKTKVQTSTTAAVTSTPTPPKRSPTTGQKEVVLPRPSNPVRRPFSELSSRSVHEPSVYDTIKKMLNMDNDIQQSETSQPQKRFVLTEDQLTSELSGLKKSPA